MAIACFDIRKQYGGFVALDDIAIVSEQAEIHGIIGPNGAGKTTLLDVLSGYLKPDAGRVLVDGRDVTGVPAFQRARRGLGRTFQSPLVPIELSVGETVEAARIAWSPKVPRGDVSRACAMARLDVGDDDRCGLLNTLNRRKLLLAVLLMRRPSVLLLDEPCSGLLQDEIDEIEAILCDVRAETGAVLIVVEHRLELLESVADRITVLDEGKVIADGTVASVFADPVVRAAYFESAHVAP